MNVQTGQWQCFFCGIRGNSYDLIRNLHTMYFEQTTDDQVDHLCKKLRRGSIDSWIVREMQLAYNTATQEWMLPAWSIDGASKGISNLYVYRKSFNAETAKMSRQILSGPTFKHVPYGVHRLRSGANRKLWILEGHWDTLAFWSLLRRITPSQEPHHEAMGAPGSGTYPKSYLYLLSGRDVIVPYDNDEAGEKGMDGLAKACAANGVTPTSLRFIKWPDGLEPGFDVTDVITRLPSKLIPRKKLT